MNIRYRSRRFYARHLVAAVAVLLLGTLAGCSSQPSSVTFQPAAGSSSLTSTPYVHLRPADEEGSDPATSVTLRSCPTASNKPVGQNPWGLNCEALANLADGTSVTMQCWVSTTTPYDEPTGSSAKWFKVTVANGADAGREGWVWSDLVANQTAGTPQCESIGFENDPTPSQSPLAPLKLTISGTCTSDGGTLTGISSGFSPGGTYDVSATRPNGQPYPLSQTSFSVHTDGSITWTWNCQGDPAGVYETTVVDTATGRSIGEDFSIGAPSPSPSPDATVRSQPPTTAPASTQPTAYYETTGSVAHTWADYADAGGHEGPSILAYTRVQIACRIAGFAVSDGNTWWYLIAASPWNSQYYVSADAFYNNGQTSGTLRGSAWVDDSIPPC